VQGYRARRDRQLRQLAGVWRNRLLKPETANFGTMPANERRVIHLELRNHLQVTTESTGDEPYRKVTIVPKI